MAKGFKKGVGGTDLNFNVIGYTTDALMQADMPRENTIGIITSHKITGYSLSANMPENMAEGEVWISIGLSSPVSFSVLRKPTIMVHPCFAKQPSYRSFARPTIARVRSSHREGAEGVGSRDGYLVREGSC